MRKILIAVLIAVVASVFGGVHAASAQAASCSNSFPADGHGGPWHTSANSTLHGNTVSVDCPAPDVHWAVDYSVQFLSNGSWFDIFSQHSQGNGSPNDFSFSLSPFTCNDSHAPFPLRTHVHNDITGGNMNKPAGGVGVHICGF